MDLVIQCYQEVLLVPQILVDLFTQYKTDYQNLRLIFSHILANLDNTVYKIRSIFSAYLPCGPVGPGRPWSPVAPGVPRKPG